jgi:hypothetical protein
MLLENIRLQSGKTKTVRAGDMQTRQLPPLFRLPNAQLDSIFNPILLYWGWGFIFFFSEYRLSSSVL